MRYLPSSASLKTLGICLVIELVIFTLFYVGTGLIVAAAYYTLMIGPLSLFLAPLVHRQFKANEHNAG